MHIYARVRDRNHGCNETSEATNSELCCKTGMFFPKRQVPVQDLHFVDVRQCQNQLQMDVHYLALCEASSENTRAIGSNNNIYFMDKISYPPTDSIDLN